MMRLPFSVLAEAKAFLCWEVLPDLSIQLIPVRQAAYYFPPNSENHFIALFYDEDQNDFRSLLCLLFHEAGHAIQYRQNRCDFERISQIPTGKERVEFEQTAWKLGFELFKRFIDQQKLDPVFISEYERVAQCSAQGYDKE